MIYEGSLIKLHAYIAVDAMSKFIRQNQKPDNSDAFADFHEKIVVVGVEKHIKPHVLIIYKTRLLTGRVSVPPDNPILTLIPVVDVDVKFPHSPFIT